MRARGPLRALGAVLLVAAASLCGAGCAGLPAPSSAAWPAAASAKSPPANPAPAASELKDTPPIGSQEANPPPSAAAAPLEPLKPQAADGAKDSTPSFAEARPLPLAEAEEGLKPTFNLRGRINADAIVVDQSEKNIEDFGNYQNVVGFRRARLGAQGKVGELVDWIAEIDFAGGGVDFKDMWVGFNELPLVRRLRVGRSRVPFSLEGDESANDFPFVERSPVNSLDPARKWGVIAHAFSDDARWTLHGGAYRVGTNSTGNDSGDGNDLGYIARATWVPWLEDDGARLIMLGGAIAQQFAKNDVVTIGQGPQSSLLTPADSPNSPFVATLSVPATQNQLYNVQTALVLGPFSFQAEWSATSIDQIGGGPVFLHGAYLFASWFLTGEHRNFVLKDGGFGVTEVRSPCLRGSGKSWSCCGAGAWELVARIAYVDFTSPNLPLNDGLLQGTKDLETTLGLNWYLNDWTRLMFNWVHAVPTDPNNGTSSANGFFIRTAIWW